MSSSCGTFTNKAPPQALPDPRGWRSSAGWGQGRSQFGQELWAVSRSCQGPWWSLSWVHGGCGWFVTPWSSSSVPPSASHAQKVLRGGWSENCPCIVCLLRVPTGQGCVRVCSHGGVPPLPSGTAASFWLPLGNIQNCFCWQRWAERISEVSCASLGGLEGDTAGPAHIPFCCAEEAWAGLGGQQRLTGCSMRGSTRGVLGLG